MQRMLCDAWDGCSLHVGHYGQHTVLYDELCKDVTPESIRKSMTCQYRAVLESMADEDISEASSDQPQSAGKSESPQSLSLETI